MDFLLNLSINKYKFLAIFWNIFLALIPCFTVYYLTVSIGRNKLKQLRNKEFIAFALIFLFWLIMLPNTAYLLTIPRHLVNYCHEWDKNRVCLEQGRTWLVMFFATYSLIGVPTYYYALNKMQHLISKIISNTAGRFLPIIVIPLTSIGVMFGLFERYNSWDVIFNFSSLMNTTFGYFTDKIMFFNFLVFTVCLFLIYYGTEFFILKIVKR